ncbi:MAG TPA: malonyl-CoA decarboxylase family protein [Burkholderiales bacterium]|nr:malonyl-CoA decarboxylase family protein [Burkholderiales bacterium]
MNVLGLLRRIAGVGAAAPVQDLAQICDALLAESGEYASTALAGEAVARLRALDDAAREQFFDVLAANYSPAEAALKEAAAAYQAAPTSENLIQLQQASESPRRELFDRLNMAEGGTAALVQMRSELLKKIKQHPAWRLLDYDLRRRLRSWFNRGFLRLERIDWRTSALVLEKLIDYEAVHAVQGWPDLRRRLQADRRCYAFFHAQLPDEPIIFIEVALTHGMSARVQPLLDVRAPLGDPMKADCAMFYSITNCQEGLRGISFGNQLIKQVAEDLKSEFPHLRRFATLSPIPGLRSWLENNATPSLVARIADPGWHLGEIPEALQDELTQLCAYYLVRAKEDGGEPLDPVARFHLGNGASLDRLNFLGDTSESGMARSAGLMVNYVYWLAELEKNHERYFRERVVSASPPVDKLARECHLPSEDAA